MFSQACAHASWASGVMPKSRAPTIDLPDPAVKAWLDEHVAAADMDIDRMFCYKKADRAKGPSWSCLQKHRHKLMDVVVLTGGKLLKLQKLEGQVGSWLEKHAPGKFNADSVSLVVRCEHDNHVLRILNDHN